MQTRDIEEVYEFEELQRLFEENMEYLQKRLKFKTIEMFTYILANLKKRRDDKWNKCNDINYSNPTKKESQLPIRLSKIIFSR